MTVSTDRMAALGQVTAQLLEAAAAKKCWRCGCLHSLLDRFENTVPFTEQPADLLAALQTARGRLEPVQYDCLGCAICYPAVATNVLSQAGYEVGGDTCVAAPVAERQGWPPLPGSYTPMHYRAPVAVCTLTDDGLAAALAKEAAPGLAIVGTLQTENLGIERLITNVLANPNIRFLIVCGADSRQAVGHLPGQALLALAATGTDDRGRIIGAQGKRPILRNIDAAAITHFRRTVEVVNLIGTSERTDLAGVVQACADRSPGLAPVFAQALALKPIKGYEPARLVQDPAGYVVIYVDRARGLLSLEHYQNNGVLDAVVEGRTAVEVYTPLIERGFITRLDHAAYVGRQLERAQRTLAIGERFVQDAAPEQTPQADMSCGCGDVACASDGVAPLPLLDLNDR